MESSSRRSFLMGRRSAATPWENFCQRVRRQVTGTLYDFGLRDGLGSARLTPKRAEDVLLARSLCADYGVVLALDGVPNAAALDEQDVLWVDPGRDMGQCQRLDEHSARWFVQPGCLLGELEAAGLQQFTDLPCHITVAAWLADRTLCDWAPGHTHESGLVQASILFADGTRAKLGPFGQDNQRPLDSLLLQKLVPALFEVAARPATHHDCQSARWPARYRLDALLPAKPHTINLAHLLLGHGGDLGWVEWLVLDELSGRPSDMPVRPDYSAQRRPDGDPWLAGSDLDEGVKAMFDAHGLFPHPGQDL